MEADDWNKRAVSQIAGISYTYRREDDKSEGLAVGDRAPDGMVSPSQRLYDLVPPDGYLLLMVLPDHPDDEVLDRASELASTFRDRFKAKGIARALVNQGNADQEWMIEDEGNVRRRYEGGNQPRAYLIRPDCHIAAYGSLDAVDGLLKEQETWLRAS